jgi:prolyl oligopeptidase
MFHTLGTNQIDDTIIYENPAQPRWGWSISISENNAYKILSISDGTEEKNRVYIQTTDSNEFLPVIDELIGEYAYLTSLDNILFFYSTENASNGKVVTLTIQDGAFVWNDLIAESMLPIRSVNIINKKILVTYLVDTLSKVKTFDLNGSFLEDFQFAEAGTIGGFYGGIDDEETYFNFTNYITPSKIYKLNLNTMEYALFWEEELTNFDSSDFTTKLWFYESKDGTKVPLHISYRSNVEVNEQTPVLLYGYGGFDIAILPGFRKSYLAWMNQGGVVAVANLRGGSEYGVAWHEAGMLFNKQNVFDDFAYAAKYLHTMKIGSAQTTAIEGRSNGGLLVGATMLQNPELFKVALPGVGVMDMLRFHKFTIGWAWTSDYGSPDDKAAFMNLLAYSPYHNIEDGRCYPTTLVITSNRDDRVVPSHSYKFAARLQAAQGCENPILIRIEDRAGHGAGTPRSKSIDAISDIYSFTLNEILKDL